MNKICKQCNINMIQLKNEITIEKEYALKHKGDGFLYNDSYYDLKASYYFCPKCGLVQLYILDEILECINKSEEI